MRLQVTEKLIRVEQRQMSDFQKGAMTSGKDFATIRLRDGIQAVVGKLPGQTATTVQTLLFDRSRFDEAAATKWCSRHGYGDQAKAFSSAGESEHGGFCFVDVLRPYEGENKAPRARSEIMWTGRLFTKKYGWVDVTLADIENMARRFEESRDHVPLDLVHGSNFPELGPDASGSYGHLEGVEIVRYGDSYAELWGDLALNPVGAKYVESGMFTFTSADFHDDDKDPDTGKPTGPILKAVALTNRPILRGQMPMAMLMSEDAERLFTEQNDPPAQDAPKREESMKFNFAEYGGPKEAEADQPTADLVKKLFADVDAKTKELSEVTGKLKTVEAAAGAAAGEAAKVVQLSERIDAQEKELADVKAEREKERCERFFAENANRIADADRARYGKLFSSDETLCREIVKGLPELYPTTRKSSGGEGKAGQSATSRFLSLVNDIQEKDKKTFTESLTIAANKDRKLFSEYENERDALAETQPARSSGVALGGEVVP